MDHAHAASGVLGDPTAAALYASRPARVRAIVRPDARWDVLLILLAGYILVAVGRIHQVFPALDVIRPVTLTGALAIALFLFDRRSDRRLSLVTAGTGRWLLALLVWMALCVPTALLRSASFEEVFGNFGKTVLMFFVVAAAVRGGRDLVRLAGAYLFASVVYAVVVLARFDVGVTDWRLGHLYYYDANDFATFAVTAMPLAIFFAHRGRRLAVRVLGVLALGVLCAAFVQTGSRGGFLALMAMGLYILLRYSSISLSRRLVALAIVTAAVLTVASDRYWQQMGSILSNSDYNQTEESGRVHIWRRGIGYMLQRPLFGVGAANFPVAEGTISEFAQRQQWGVGVRWNAPHNTFIQVGAENGVPGLVFFIALIGSAFLALHKRGVRTRNRAAWLQAPPELVQALTASLLGFLVGAFFLSLAYSELLCMLLAFAVAAQKVARARRAAPVAA